MPAKHEQAAAMTPVLATTAAFYIFQVVRRVYRGSYTLHQAGMIWAQHGCSSNHIAALKVSVAVLITRRMHTDTRSFAGILGRFKTPGEAYHASGVPVNSS
jgi:hypothetical protein